MNAIKRLLAAKSLNDVDQYLQDLDVEFFHKGNMIVVVLDNQNDVEKIVDELKGPFHLRIDSPQVIRDNHFALVGDVIVQRAGDSLRIFKSK